MLGLVSEWIWLLSMAGAAVTRSLLPRDRAARPRGVQSGACRGPASHRPAPGLASKRAAVDAILRRHGGRRRRSPSATIFTETRLDSWLALGLLVAAGLYLYGVHRLRAARRPLAGRPHRRVPRPGPRRRSRRSRSAGWTRTTPRCCRVHMVQHMVLSMVAPIFLALGAPVTLALRTLPARPRRRAAGGAAQPGRPGADASRWWRSGCSWSTRSCCTSPACTG